MIKISKYCREQNMKLTGVIYKITNIINNKVYIGQTVNTIKYRWHKHCNSDGCRSLHNAILKYGKENFNIEIIETLPIEKLDEREIYWISFYKSNTKKFGYNILLGGNLGRKGFSKLSKEQINEIIELDKQGITHIEIGKKFNINRKTVTFILRRESDYTSKHILLYERKDLNEIKEFLKINPTSKEVMEKFKISSVALFKFTKSIGYHFLHSSKRRPVRI